MYDDRFIPKIKFNPEKAFMATIAHDFHYINKEGELTLPWFDHDSMQKRNVSQKNIFTFSATSVDQDNRHETYGDNIKKEHTNEPDKHIVVSKKTIKIPFYTFVKIHNFRYPPISIEANTDNEPQIEVTAEQELVSLSGHNPELKDILEDNLELDNRNILNKDTVVSKKTIKIPFSTFAKIHNFRYPPISIKANTTSVPQMKAIAEKELVSLSGHNPELKDILEENLELDNRNILNKDTVVSKKTIKIPFSTFAKIHNFRYPPISIEANTDNEPQIENAAEQELMSQSEHNLEIDNAIVLNKYTVISKKTIKIPFSTFAKIHNIRYPAISIETNADNVPQIENTAEQRVMSQTEHIDEMEKIIEDNLEIENAIVLNKQTVVRKKTIKIPFSTFAKIHNIRYPAISIEANTDNVPQIENTAEQRVVSQTEHIAEIEDILEDNLGIENAIVLNKQTVLRKKTIKIPFSTFAKIHSLRYPAISIETNTDNVPQIENTAEQREVSQTEHIDEMENIIEDNLEIENAIVFNKQTVVSKKTIKIPFSTFTKIHNLRYPAISLETNTDNVPQMEAIAKQELVSQSEHNPELEDILGLADNLEIDNENVLNKDKVVSKKTIKIPFSTFTKIHNLRYPAISIEANTDSAPQKEFVADQQLVSQFEQNPELEDILGIADNLEINHANEPDKHTKMHKKTIKIPLTVFRKIHNTRNSSILPNAKSSIDLQPETLPNQSEHSLEKEDKIVLDATIDTSNDENKHKMEDFDNVDIKQSNNLNGHTMVRSKTIKIPISTFAEIDNFHHPPIFGSTFQNTFKFIDPSDHNRPQLETDIIDTITYFHEQPYCHLVGFKSHEMIFSTDHKSVDRENMKKQKVNNRAVVVPIHDNSMKAGETNNVYPNHKYVNTRVPVVVGEYNLEVCLDEDVLFEEKVYKVKEISKIVELTNCKFVPTRFAPSPADEGRIVLKGKLFIEGNIHQSIEYIADVNIDKNTNTVKQEQLLQPLHQKIVIELIIQLLQVQTVSTVINQQLT